MAIVKDRSGNEILVTLTERSTLKFLEMQSCEYVEFSNDVDDDTMEFIAETQTEALKQDVRARDKISWIGLCFFFGCVSSALFCSYKIAEGYFQNKFAEKQLEDWRVSQESVPNVSLAKTHRFGSNDREIQSIMAPVETMTPDVELKKISMMFKVLADKYSPIRERNVIPFKVFQKINTRFVDAGNEKKDWAGYCEELKSDKVTIGTGIVIDINIWLRAGIDYWNREELVFHEYGHCILGLDHDNEMITLNGETIPRSIMNSRMFGGTTYLRFREYYLTELFSHLREKAKEIHLPGHAADAETVGDGQYYYEDSAD